jgi:hypothetical protein
MKLRRRAITFVSITAIMLAPVHLYANAAEKAGPLKLEIAREGDADMTCEQLWKEAYLMRSIIAQTRDIQHDSKMRGRGIGVVGTAASYIVGTITGGLSIAAAGLLASNANNIKSEDAELIQETAQQRRALITGIFTAKKCEGPIEDALDDTPRRTDNIEKVEPAAGEKDMYDLAKPRYNQ